MLRPATQDLAALIGTGTIDPSAAALLDDIIAARLAFLISGGTGAGKTTLLAALLGAVPRTNASSAWRTPPNWNRRTRIW